MHRPHFSSRLKKIGWFLLPIAAFAIGGFIYQKTVQLCEYGPRPRGWIYHLSPFGQAVGLSLVAWVLLVPWLIVTTVHLVRKKPLLRKMDKVLVGAVAVVLAPGLVGESHWNRLALHRCGPGKYGVAFLSEAARAGDARTVDFLAQRGVPLDFESNMLWDSPLVAAIRGNEPKMVLLLLSKGVSPNATGAEVGVNPLVTAVDENNAEIVNILLSAGASACVRNEQGYTPLHLAEERHLAKILALLKQKPCS